MIKPPDAETYIKPTRKRLLPELILGLIMFCVGILVFGTNELIGGLIAIGGLAVIVIFLRKEQKNKRASKKGRIETDNIIATELLVRHNRTLREPADKNGRDP